MEALKRWHVELILLMFAYPLTHIVVQHIPNPFIPAANIALNMVFPVLAGYFYGPISGALVGALGTGLSALIYADIYDAMAILPHTIMGATAGWVGASRSQITAAMTIMIGHALNVLFFWRFGLLVIDQISTLLLGLLTETSIGVVAIILLIVLLQKRFYKTNGERW